MIIDVMYSIPVGLAAALAAQEENRRNSESPLPPPTGDEALFQPYRQGLIDRWRQAQGLVCLTAQVDEAVLQTLIDDPRVRVLGVWKQDGWPLGVDPVYDDEGTFMGITGTPVALSPPNDFLGHMPDIDGLRPSAPYTYSKHAGWAHRVYDLSPYTVL